MRNTRGLRHCHQEPSYEHGRCHEVGRWVLPKQKAGAGCGADGKGFLQAKSGIPLFLRGKNLLGQAHGEVMR